MNKESRKEEAEALAKQMVKTFDEINSELEAYAEMLEEELQKVKDKKD